MIAINTAREQMRSNAQLVEVFPLPDDPELSGQPELQAFKGSGETELVPEALEMRAGFHVVADQPDVVHEAAETATENTPEADATEVAEIVAYVDLRTGRTERYAGSKTVELAISDDDYTHRGGGGGAIYWFLKMQAEKYHDVDTCHCYFCGISAGTSGLLGQAQSILKS